MADNVFAGDVLIRSTENGGEIVIEEGLVSDCRDFETAVFLSLFGGNEDDLYGRAKSTWWGNLIPGTEPKEKLVSEFGAIVKGFPLTSGNLVKAEMAAKRDLAWLKSEADADELNVSLSAENGKRVQLTVEAVKNGNITGLGKYDFQWEEAVR